MTKPKEWFAKRGIILWLIASGSMSYGLWAIGPPQSWHDVSARVALSAGYVALMLSCVAWGGYFERKGRDEERERALSKQGERG